MHELLGWGRQPHATPTAAAGRSFVALVRGAVPITRRNVGPHRQGDAWHRPARGTIETLALAIRWQLGCSSPPAGGLPILAWRGLSASSGRAQSCSPRATSGGRPRDRTATGMKPPAQNAPSWTPYGTQGFGARSAAR